MLFAFYRENALENSTITRKFVKYCATW